MTKEEIRERNRNRKEYFKAYRKAHRHHLLEYGKEWHESHKEQCNVYQKAYNKSDVNSLGQTKDSIRHKSQRYLKKYGTKIEGYQIHHCCTYTEPYKFIYCNRELHRLIHSYLKQHNLDADSNHYEYIKHLLDEHVVKYGID